MKRSSRVRGNRSGKERAVSTETGGALGSGLEVAEPLTGGPAERPMGVGTGAMTWELWLSLQG